jgi:hypothetical protein
MNSFAVELAAVAVAFAVLFALVHVVMMAATDFSMTHAGMIVCAALAGALGHAVFEYTGLNNKFVEVRTTGATYF